MTNGSSDRLDRVEALLEQMAINQQRSDERLDRLVQIVESNNRFLEAFGANVNKLTETVDRIGQRMDGIVATGNQDRQEASSRLSVIQRKIDAIARHLGVDQA